jgi:hypothetical protein
MMLWIFWSVIFEESVNAIGDWYWQTEYERVKRELEKRV